MNLISVSQHLGRFKEAIFSIEEQCLEFAGATNLLDYASGIQGINYSAASEAGMYCRGVADFERSQEDVLNPYLAQLTIFTVSWMALESMIDELSSKHNDVWPNDYGKIGNLCYFLKNEADNISLIPEYIEHLEQWKSIESTLQSNYKGRSVIPSHVCKLGEGIYRLYKLRNHLFHGEFSGYFPEDSNWHDHTKALEVGIRIIAFTIQMAFMATFKNAEYLDCYWHGSLSEENEQESIKKALGVLHVEWI